MAGEHLPRRRMRRAVAPLLLLVRPRPRVVAPVRAAARDPLLSRTPRGQQRPAPAHPAQYDRGGRELRRREGTLDAPHRRRRRAFVRRPHHRLRAAEGPGDPADRGDRGLRGPRVSLRRVGPRPRAREQVRRRARDRGERRPVHSRGGQGRGTDDDLPALRAVDPAEGGPPLPRTGSAACSSGSRPASPPRGWGSPRSTSSAPTALPAPTGSSAGCRRSPTTPGGRSSEIPRSSPRPRPTTRWAASGSSSRTTGTRP